MMLRPFYEDAAAAIVEAKQKKTKGKWKMGKSLVERERDDDIAVRGDTINLSTQRMI